MSRELEEWAPQVLAALRQLPGLRDLSTDQQDRGLQATLVSTATRRPDWESSSKQLITRCMTLSANGRYPRCIRS